MICIGQARAAGVKEKNSPKVSESFWIKLINEPSETLANIDILKSLSYNKELICAIILSEKILVYVSEHLKEKVYVKKHNNNKIIVVNKLNKGLLGDVSSKCVIISPNNKLFKLYIIINNK